jgi:ankyrin repeat protein
MPLHIAIHRKRPKEVKVLLDAGADPDAPGEYGERPLHIAIRRLLFEIVEMLLRAGARCDLKDGNGMGIWDQAEASGVKQRLKELDLAIRREKGFAP